MDPGTALGVASLGLQVCEGILKYYDKWRSYDADIRDTYRHITELRDTFARLRVSLEKISYDKKQSDHAKDALRPCEESLLDLQELLAKLKPYNAPTGLREAAWAQFRRATYPLKASTLSRLREIDEDIRDRLDLALQTLQIDIAAVSQAQLSNIERDIGSVDVSLNRLALQTNAAADGVETLLRAEEQRKLEEILRWLSPDFQDPWLDYKAARDRHEPGTGDWLLANKSFKAWKRGQTQTPHVWLHGKAGCGKTVLCSTVIDDMRPDFENAPSKGFALFFFSFANQKKQTVDDMLLSLIAQLAGKSTGLAILVAAYEKYRNGASVHVPLDEIFRNQIDALTETVIFLDALDECPGDGDSQRKLLDCLQSNTTYTRKLRLFATSRDESLIRDCMQAIHADAVSIVSGHTDGDIKRYLNHEVQNDPRLRLFDEKSRLLIERTLAEKADGMFRWAYCQLEELKKLKIRTAKKVGQVLSDLPRTLDETYDRMLSGIAESNRREARTILRWLVIQTRPMTLVELAETCIIDPDSGLICEEDRPDPHSLADLLGSLVVAREVKVKISDVYTESKPGLMLAHFSVQEYLESTRIRDSKAPGTSFWIDRAQAHAFVADSCVTYLDWSLSLITRAMMLYSRSYFGREALPLSQYARREWPKHISARSEPLPWQQIRLEQHLQAAWRTGTIYDCAFYGEAFKCLPQAFQTLCKRDMKLDVTLRCHGETKLHVAVSHGVIKVVDMLLSAGAKTECADRSGQTALSIAANKGFTEIVGLLLHAGADIEHKAPLCKAARLGHIDVVRLLLDAGADIENGRPLKTAICWGHVSVVELLVERGADVGGDLLHHFWYSTGPRLYLSRYLVSKGADVTCQDDLMKRTPLHCLDDELAQLAESLLEHGADIEARDKRDYTPLLSALLGGSHRVAQCLVELGADIDATSSLGESALHLASRTDRIALVKYCLEAGAHIDGKTDVANTPLHEAVRASSVNAVQYLLDHGASIYAETNEGATALSVARSRLDEFNCDVDKAWSVVNILIDRSDLADLQTRAGSGRELLHQAVRWGRPDMMQKLLDRGIDMTAKTASGNSPIAIAKQTLAQLQSFKERAVVEGWMEGVQQVIDLLSPHVTEAEGRCEEYPWTEKERKHLLKAYRDRQRRLGDQAHGR